MLIKRKSLIVALISSLIMAAVMGITLIGYIIYMEFKDDEFNAAYKIALDKINAKYYAKHIEVVQLSASIEKSGPLTGKAVLEGIVRNDGEKDIEDLILKIMFLDENGAVLYEVIFHPQEPSLGTSILNQISAAHLFASSNNIARPESSVIFKKVLMDCPKEIISELKKSAIKSNSKGRWAGRFAYDVISVKFQ